MLGDSTGGLEFDAVCHVTTRTNSIYTYKYVKRNWQVFLSTC